MKKNRQIGLDGKVFISASLRRGTLFVFALMLYGALNAFSDILKLTGASGAVMSTFTTTLLIFDFIVSLLLVVVVFYAYFLECGSSVPVLRHKPLVVFGFFRLGYYILLSYYVCYRALYCLTHTSVVRLPMFFFYANYFALIFCCIIANCSIYNVLTRNVIRRSYRRSFHTLATAGIVTQILLPITYIIARVTMADVGDEFFTGAFCDLLRLCVCPLLLSSVWFIFLHSIRQIDEVFDEVDDALRNKRYQITYSAITDGKNSKKKESAVPVAAAAFLPAPSKTVNPISGSTPNVGQLASGTAPKPPVMSPAEREFAKLSPEERAEAAASITDAATQMEASMAPAQPVQTPPPVRMPVNNQPAPAAAFVPAPAPQMMQQTQNTMNALPVQEYDPFPEEKVPLHVTTKRRTGGSNGKQAKGGKQNPKAVKRSAQGGGQRPQGGKPPVQGNRPAQGSRGQNGSQNRSGHR